MRCFQPRPDRLEEYWTVDATKLETNLRGDMSEEGWLYRKIDRIITGSDEGKSIKRIYDKTHKSDRGGGGVLWSEYNSNQNPHIVLLRKPVKKTEIETGKRGTQSRKNYLSQEKNMRT